MPVGANGHSSRSKPAPASRRTAARRDFLVGPENELLCSVMQSALAELPCEYNPLVFYGVSGTGKSHLAQGLAAYWRERAADWKVLCVTASDFANEYLEAVQTKTSEDFRERYEQVNLLVLEDLGQLRRRTANFRESAQQELARTIEHVLREGGQVVVTCDATPGSMYDLVPALRSRLLAGLTVSLSLPGLATRFALVERLAADRGLTLEDPTAAILAEALEVTAPELHGALVQIVGPHGDKRKLIRPEDAEEFLSQRYERQPPELAEIARQTARHFGVTLAELRGPSRRRSIVRARGVATLLARNLTRHTLEEIGQQFGGRDHSTVLHALKTTGELLQSDREAREAYDHLTDVLTLS